MPAIIPLIPAIAATIGGTAAVVGASRAHDDQNQANEDNKKALKASQDAADAAKGRQDTIDRQLQDTQQANAARSARDLGYLASRRNAARLSASAAPMPTAIASSNPGGKNALGS